MTAITAWKWNEFSIFLAILLIGKWSYATVFRKLSSTFSCQWSSGEWLTKQLSFFMSSARNRPLKQPNLNHMHSNWGQVHNRSKLGIMVHYWRSEFSNNKNSCNLLWQVKLVVHCTLVSTYLVTWFHENGTSFIVSKIIDFLSLNLLTI